MEETLGLREKWVSFFFVNFTNQEFQPEGFFLKRKKSVLKKREKNFQVLLFLF